MPRDQRQIVVRYRIGDDCDPEDAGYGMRDVDAEINNDYYCAIEFGEGVRALAVALGKVFAEAFADDPTFNERLEKHVLLSGKYIRDTANHYRKSFKKKNLNIN